MRSRLNYFRYLLTKPTHSALHKKLKRQAKESARTLGLYEKVLQEISQYTHEDAGTVEEKEATLLKEIATHSYDTLTEEELMRFYTTTNHYIYELPLWNARDARGYYIRSIILPYIKKNRYQNILDFGGGSGDLCIALKETGLSVSYTDINEPLIDFCRWRFQKRNLAIQVFSAQELTGKTFDCIVSFDVFEHFMNLPEKVADLYHHIRGGGSLIFNIEESGDGLHLQENKIYTQFDALNKVMHECGFIFAWKFKGTFFYKKP